VIETSYGQAVGLVFLIGVPLLVIAAVAIAAIREVPLRQSIMPDAADENSQPVTSPAAG
jgi:hypothetical protein